MRQANQSAVRQAREIVNQTFQQQREEQRSWDKIFKKWPEVEKDKKSVNLIHTVRLGQLAKGESPDLYKIAKDLMGGRETAKSEGIKSANDSTKVQKCASLEASSSTNKGASASQNELLEKTSSRNRLEADAARQELIRQMMDDGRL